MHFDILLLLTHSNSLDIHLIFVILLELLTHCLVNLLLMASNRHALVISYSATIPQVNTSFEIVN